MSQDTRTAKAPRISRRSFLQTTAGLVSVAILDVPGMAFAKEAASQIPVEGGIPGKASQRIEGLAKVTGKKIYARDFNARDMSGWPDDQWYALYVRATTTKAEFLGLDLSSLPANAHPTRLIYGDQVNEDQRSPKFTENRGHPMEAEAIDPACLPTSGSFDKPEGLTFDLVVKRNAKPDFLGQAVALLLFSSRSAYLKAKSEMQFQDDKFQRYSDEIPDGPLETLIFPPETHYVKVTGPADKKVDFSYASMQDSAAYKKEIPEYVQLIEDFLAIEPELITHPFKTNMRAMDPMFMEPESGLVWYDRANQNMNLLLGTQSPDGDLEHIASMYGEPDSPLPLSNMTLTSCYPGGGFGGRDSSPFSFMLALCAAFTDGAPVKLAYDRFEQFRVGLKRHAADLDGVLAVTKDQKMKVIKMQMTFDGGGRKNLSPYVAGLGALCAGGAYDVPLANIHAKAVHSENISGGSQRGFGGPQAFFAIETAIDQIVHNQGWDPVEFRRKNLLVKNDQTVVGGPIEQDLRLDELLEIAENHPVWADRKSIKQEYAARGMVYGTGLAMSLQAYGTSGDGVVGAVKLNPDGTLTVLSDAVDMGNGSATTLGVVIGDILGSNATHVEMGDYTLFGKTGLKTGCTVPAGEDASWANPHWTAKGVGSSSACLTAFHQVHVVQEVARAFFQNSILPAAAAIWKVKNLTANVTKWIDGALVSPTLGKGPIEMAELTKFIYDKGLSTGALAHAYFQGDWVRANFKTAQGMEQFKLDGLAFYKSGSDTPAPVWREQTQPPPPDAKWYSRTLWAPCVNLIGLTVDPKTGVTKIEKSVSVLNAGKIHVEQLVSGQSQGGLAMAIGYTLMEDMPPGMSGPADGEWNLNRYFVPRMADVPLNKSRHKEAPTQELITLPELPGQTSSGRGIAEAVMCSIAPAISNALHDATGFRFTSLPITADKIRKRYQS